MDAFNFQSQRKSCALRLTCKRQRNDCSRAFVKDVVTNYKDWTLSRLLMAARRGQVSPIDLAS